MRGRALLIVEPEFLNVHVGIRRITFYFWAQLQDRGYEVSVATAGKDGLRLRETPPLAALAREIAATEERNDRPAWTSGQPWTIGPEQPRDKRTLALPAAGTPPLSDLDAFEVSLVANPWLCVNGLPPGSLTVGVVADMVPNLLALGALRMDAFLDVYPFAHAHEAGYRLYLERAAHICCISESTREDFRLVCRLDRMDPRAVVCIPYAHAAAGETSPSRDRGKRPRILLVNALDHRKNFSAIGRALASIARDTRFEVDVVGRERIPMADASRFLQDLASLGLPVRWFRGPSDASYVGTRRRTSFYSLLINEGLGLPDSRRSPSARLSSRPIPHPVSRSTGTRRSRSILGLGRKFSQRRLWTFCSGAPTSCVARRSGRQVRATWPRAIRSTCFLRTVTALRRRPDGRC